MKTRINFTIENQLVNLLKRKRINISKYVEKLVTANLLNMCSNQDNCSLSGFAGSNPALRIHLSKFISDKNK